MMTSQTGILEVIEEDSGTQNLQKARKQYI